MKTVLRLMTTAAVMLVSCVMQAQAPAGSTGQCKDGTYTSATSRMGACRGHQGVKTWFAAASPGTTAAPAGATAGQAATIQAKPNAASAATTKIAAQSAGTAAPGGGPGMVWLNTESNVYHCPGTKFYGKTKTGSYVTEAAAKAKGARADHNQACSK